MNVCDILYVNGSSGNVGIGTAGPGSRLEVEKTVANAAYEDLVIIDSNNINVGGGGGIKFKYSASPLARIAAKGGPGGFGGSLYFDTQASGGDGSDRLGTKMTILDSGNVGIGTTSPGELLHLRSATPEQRFNDTDNPNWWDVGAVGDDFKIALNDSTTDVLYIDQDGNVGIGDTTPPAPLSFGSSTGDKISLYDDGTASYNISIENNQLIF